MIKIKKEKFKKNISVIHKYILYCFFLFFHAKINDIILYSFKKNKKYISYGDVWIKMMIHKIKINLLKIFYLYSLLPL